MEVVSSSTKEQLRVKVETLQAVLEQCQRAIDSLKNVDGGGSKLKAIDESPCGDQETDEVLDLIKSRINSPRFLKTLGDAQMSASQCILEEGSSWDLVGKHDLWEGANIEPDQEGYVLVEQEDIVEGIACFMTTYLMSLKETKVLSPNQLQKALSNTFTSTKKRGKLQKAWDGSKAIYNVASWGATAIGIYQNPALISAASMAFWKSCHVISKFF